MKKLKFKKKEFKFTKKYLNYKKFQNLNFNRIYEE